MRATSSLLVVALATSVASAAPKVTAKAKATAKKHMEKAAAATTEGRHQDALTELDAAYALDPQPMLLLARGHLYVKLEKCEDAIKLYEEYLATKPAQEMADSAQAAIDSCKAALAPPPPPPEPVTPSKVTSEELNIDDENPTLTKANRPNSVQRASEPGATPPPKQVDAGPSEPRPWFKDPILLGLSIGGAAAMTTSLVFYMAARSKIDSADSATTYGEWIRNETEARDPRRYSIIFAAVGTVLVGGAVFYGLRRQDSEPSRVSVMPTGDGAMVGYGGRF